MSDIAIRVENLSKLYTSGRSQQRHAPPARRDGTRLATNDTNFTKTKR